MHRCGRFAGALGITEAGGGAAMAAAAATPAFRDLPKTGNQKGNFVVVTMGRRRESLFDLFV